MFFSHSLVANVYRLLETYRFSLPARRFVYGLIDGAATTEVYWQPMYAHTSHAYLADEVMHNTHPTPIPSAVTDTWLVAQLREHKPTA
jgi:hypothetical protein